jgi:hypothetical protein
VFPHACNLRLEDGVLLTLLPSENSNVPMGIRVDGVALLATLPQVRVGQAAACRGGVLRIGETELAIDLRAASRWHIDLVALQVDLRRPEVACAWTVAWRELAAHRCSDGFSAMITPVFAAARAPHTSVTQAILGQLGDQAVRALLEATHDRLLTDAIIAMRPMIGLGPGLTPSGDDFLVGFLAGLWTTAGNEPARLRFLNAASSWLCRAAEGRTNSISHAYLESAARGHVSEPIATLAQQVSLAQDVGGVRVATQAAMSVGHTSGAAGTLGLLLGWLAWATPSQFLVAAAGLTFPSSFSLAAERQDHTPTSVASRAMEMGLDVTRAESRPEFALDEVYNFVFKWPTWKRAGRGITLQDLTFAN